MARIKYYYDTETCRYERVKVSKWDILLNLLGFLSVSLILAVGIIITYNAYFDSPKEARLKKENKELQFYYNMMEKEVQNMQSVLGALQERDDEVYRNIMGTEPIPSSIRQAGVGGAERYKNIIESELEREKLIMDMMTDIDKVKKQMYIQTKSYDEILEMARDKEKMLAAMPAIQPIPNKELKRLASGYGMRMHPILKVVRMHEGCDFSAPRGTPIYATGDGEVVRISNTYGGFGKLVVIDHGYGFVTKYAHMSSFNVKKGDKVKRGDCIGFVGNTGSSTAPHLHYEIHHKGKPINPIHYFYQDVTDGEYEKLLELSEIKNQSLG
ncbi:M23 family metallopeptidase [Marivirga atlantica]|jgi:murein DD-endopeptidase MepM/ murein hydrolase activator NlpD|uniref:M23 family metallopeptidase n=1 Tax=Marivirga atlantica TaxID=1548457 RepID=A0A937AEM8_9BACT|nr:M23 family metallopeptidase [Marivirga atlantica]MBL0764843.1 M23 family metallopeptidase [Marivirga atlantica]